MSNHRTAIHACALLLMLGCASQLAGGKPQQSALRWEAGQPYCALVKGQDGVYRYSISYEVLSVTMAVDSQELEMNRRTLERVLRLFITVRNLGRAPVDVHPGKITLELVRHYHVRLRSEDPDDFSRKLQDDSDELVHQGERELKKHPERKDKIEERLREHEKLVAEWQQFLSTKSLAEATLDGSQPEVSGVVLFDTRTKWKGAWKAREDFVLRIPLGKITFEFPFTLPPQEGPTLRQRSSE